MPNIHQATDVQQNFEAILHQVLHNQPAMVQQNQTFLAFLSLDHLMTLLNSYRLHVEYEQEDDGTYSGSFVEIDLVANAETVDALKLKLTEYLLDYAQDYMNEFSPFYNAPNRRPH
ncbi:MAG TPA: hypothetical protein VFV52_16525, partial [Bacilli bacterium]|nr:hypothetical protein [Bacilli bacterium]